MRGIFGLLLLLVLAAGKLRGSDIVTRDTPRAFPDLTTKAQWRERSRAIREQILVSSGLWPMPEKTPLKARVFDKMMRDGYSVEKVYFQSYPGFYVGGDLYRPLGRGNGPLPAILNPHGHWDHGRLEDTDIGSIPARCINFAKQGMIAFSYDMVGYNDTRFADSPPTAGFSPNHYSFAKHGPACLLWNVTLMGLQTWNSIRALDFLESLPDVDKRRLACTGASGGGTQTFILGAIDDRLAAQAPVVMVSHTMQGGCVCENMPGLRVDYSNVEIAAAAAPRPQILVADTSDWTKTTPTMEGPAIEHIYQLFGAPEKLRYVCFDAVHNYNQASRQSVYQWFDRWLLRQADRPVAESAFKKEADSNLLVFADGKLPPDAISQDGLISQLIQLHKDQLRRIAPTNKASLANYRRIIEPAWKRTLQLSADHPADVSGSDPRGVICIKPDRAEAAHRRGVVLLAHPDGKKHYFDSKGNPAGLARKLLDNGFMVGIVEDAGSPATSNQTSIFYNTYNRTRLQERVRALVSACEGLRRHYHDALVTLCAGGGAGLWALLAAPAADAVVADCDQLDVTDDLTLLEPDLFCPGIRNIDTFAGAPILAVPRPLLLFNVAKGFPDSGLRDAYRALRAEKKLRIEPAALTDDQIATAVLAIEQQKNPE